MISMFQSNLMDFCCFMWSSPRYWGTGAAIILPLFIRMIKFLGLLNDFPQVMEVKERGRTLTWVLCLHVAFSSQTCLIQDHWSPFHCPNWEGRGSLCIVIQQSQPCYLFTWTKSENVGSVMKEITLFFILGWDIRNDGINHYFTM